MKKSVFGILKDKKDAERVVDQLKEGGFLKDDISLLYPAASGSEGLVHEHGTKAPEGVTTGGTTGFVVGGVLGWLAGIGLLAIPGIGPFIAAGPIMAALSGAAVGAAVGGITGALIGMGIPEYEARRYEAKVKEGNVLISVHTDDDAEVEHVKSIFKAAQAEDVASSGEIAVPQTQSRVNEPHVSEFRTGETREQATSVPSQSTSSFAERPAQTRTTSQEPPAGFDPGEHDRVS